MSRVSHYCCRSWGPKGGELISRSAAPSLLGLSGPGSSPGLFVAAPKPVPLIPKHWQLSSPNTDY